MVSLPPGRFPAIALIVVLGIAAYFNTLDNGFHYDDEHSILENHHVRSLLNLPAFFLDPGTFSGLPQARMYRPVLLVTYALNYAVGGYEPFGYHLVNLFLHLLNVLLVWRLAGALGNGRGALCGALLFLLHPVMTEPVNYISSRSSLLAASFCLVALLLMVRQRQARWGAAAIAASFAAALGAKSIAVSWLPLAAAYVWLWGRRELWRLWLAPAAIAVVYILFTRSMIADAVLTPVRSHGVQWATQVKAGIYYLWTVIMPTSLSVEPQFLPGGFELSVGVAALALVSLSAVVARGWRTDRLLAFAGIWFFVTLLPASLVPLYILVNEHRLYLPMVGVALAVGNVAAGRYRLPLVVALLAVLLGHTVQRNRQWVDGETLWADAVAKGPLMARPHANLGKSYLEQGRHADAARVSNRAIELDPTMERAHYNLGTARLQEGKPDLAIAHYRRALELRPDLFEARNNMGNALQELGRLREAVAAYGEAAKLLPRPQVFHNMGSALLRLGDHEAASDRFRQALALDPGMRESYLGLSKAQRRAERHRNAVATLETALRRWPGDQVLWRMAGEAHAALGEGEKAMRAFRRGGESVAAIHLRLGAEALRRQMLDVAAEHFRAVRAAVATAAVPLLPVFGDKLQARALNGLGEVARGRDQFADALRLFRQAAQTDPQSAPAYANIGRTLLRHGGAMEAVAAFERAVELEPANGHLRALLGESYQAAGRSELAIKAFGQAIQLAPERAEYHHNLGLIYHRNQLLSAAEKAFRAALERQPGLAAGHYNLGNLLLDGERPDAALAAYEATLRLQPEHADALINMAATLLRLERAQDALAAYRHFLQVHGREHPLAASVVAEIERLAGNR